MTVLEGGIPGLEDRETGARLVAIEVESGFSSSFVDGMLEGMPGWIPTSREDVTIDGHRAIVMHGHDDAYEGVVVALGTDSRTAAVYAAWPIGTDPGDVLRAVLALRWTEAPVASNDVPPVVLGPAREGLWETVAVTGRLPIYIVPGAHVRLAALTIGRDDPRADVEGACGGAMPDLPALTTLELDSRRPIRLDQLAGCEIVGRFVTTGGQPTLGYRIVLALDDLLVLVTADAPLAEAHRWIGPIRELAGTLRRR